MANRHPPSHAGRPTRRAFTLVELLVAAVIVSVALLGVYSVFVAAVEAESRTTARWQRRAVARAAADEIAASLEAATNLPGIPAIVAGPDEQGGYALQCLAQGVGASDGSAPRPPLVRRLYRWGDGAEARAEPRAGPGAELGADPRAPRSAGPRQSLLLRVQTMGYAGSKDLTPSVSAGDSAEAPAEDAARWALVPPVTVAAGLTSLSVTFRPAGDPDAPWQDQYRGRAGDVLVRVTAAAGPETVERVVLSKANGDVVHRDE
jgi:prepilin-type N-terminal cleavage/methylation domain-containing protein